jgi:pyruvate dehydrogenase E2 component (dihydrolipoamide acetyltransferase)
VSEPIQAITMPKWGLAMEEGMLVEWNVEVGDEVSAGQEILEIETTKITNVLESQASGTLRRRVAEEGETLVVGALLGVVADPSVSDAELDGFIEAFNANFAVAAAEAESGAPEPEIVELAGGPLCYLAMGEGEGPPLVLVHGFGGDMNNWMFNQPALAESCRVLAVDLPGHGRSGKEVGAGDLVSLSRSLVAFLDALDIKQAFFAGHSLGGAILLDIALNHPDRVAGMTLVSPAGLGPEINGGYIQGFVSADRRKEMKGVLQQLFADPELVSRDMVNDILKYKRLDGVGTALATLSASLFPDGRQATVVAERLSGLAMPVQIVWGAQDKILPVSHSEGLPASIPVHICENAGHMAHMEAAAEVNSLIAQLQSS